MELPLRPGFFFHLGHFFEEWRFLSKMEGKFWHRWAPDPFWSSGCFFTLVPIKKTNTHNPPENWIHFLGLDWVTHWEDLKSRLSWDAKMGWGGGANGASLVTPLLSHSSCPVWFFSTLFDEFWRLYFTVPVIFHDFHGCCYTWGNRIQDHLKWWMCIPHVWIL